MKPLKIFPAIIWICGLALAANTNAQDRSSFINFTYQFEYRKIVQGDTLPILYCVMKISDISNFDWIYLSYNNKTLSYDTRNLLTAQSEAYYLDGDFICLKIQDNLTVPFVVIEGVDREGKKYFIKERNARGQVIDPIENKERWEKYFNRIDSIDYVRQYHGVYKGRDGKPRFRDQSGQVYIIEKDHIRTQ